MLCFTLSFFSWNVGVGLLRVPAQPAGASITAFNGVQLCLTTYSDSDMQARNRPRGFSTSGQGPQTVTCPTTQTANPNGPPTTVNWKVCDGTNINGVTSATVPANFEVVCVKAGLPCPVTAVNISKTPLPSPMWDCTHIPLGGGGTGIYGCKTTRGITGPADTFNPLLFVGVTQGQPCLAGSSNQKPWTAGMSNGVDVRLGAAQSCPADAIDENYLPPIATSTPGVEYMGAMPTTVAQSFNGVTGGFDVFGTALFGVDTAANDQYLMVQRQEDPWSVHCPSDRQTVTNANGTNTTLLRVLLLNLVLNVIVYILSTLCAGGCVCRTRTAEYESEEERQDAKRSVRNVQRVDIVLSLTLILLKFVLTCVVMGSAVKLYGVFNSIATFSAPGSNVVGLGCSMSTFVNPLDTMFVTLAAYMKSAIVTNSINLCWFVINFVRKIRQYRTFQSEMPALTGKECMCCGRVGWEWKAE